MNKSLIKISLVLCLVSQLVLGQILMPIERMREIGPSADSCSDRLVCQSNNDPHMVNFWNQPYEFQDEDGEHCLHLTTSVYVSASFYQCPYPHLNAKCNCDVRITLLNSGEQASISNCGNSVFTTNVLGFSSSPFTATCQTVGNQLFNPLEESHWALLPVTTGNTFFSCVIFNGDTYIKTRLSMPNENVIVKVAAGMINVLVYASKSYQASLPPSNDKCLCERKMDYDITQYHEKFAAEMPEQITKCKQILLNECFTNLAQNDGFLSARRVQELDKLILNCAFDLNIKRVKDTNGIPLDGAFQQNEIQNEINTAILEAIANPDNQKLITGYCICQSKIDPRNMDICTRLNILL